MAQDTNELDRAYEALKQAHEAGNAEDAQQIADYIRTLEPQVKARKVPEQDLVSPELTAVGGATAALIGGRAMEGFEQDRLREVARQARVHVPEEVIKNGRNAVINYINAMHTGDISYVGGESFGEANKLTEAAKERAKLAPPGQKYDVESGLFMPEEEYNKRQQERAIREKAKAAAEQKTKTPFIERLATRSPAAARNVAGIGGMLKKGVAPPFVERTAAGAYGGYSLADAINRGKQGDIPGAAISGTGALGSALTVSKNPKARAAGLGLMGLSYLGNRMYDSPAEEGPGLIEAAAPYYEGAKSFFGYKAGGLARLADGGKTPKGGSPKKRVAEFVIGKAPRAIKDILESKQAPMLRPSGEGPLLPQVSNPYIAELPDVLPQKRLIRGTNPRLERLINDPRAYEAIEKAMQHGVNIDPKLAYWYGTNRLLTGMQNEGSTFEDFDRLMKHMASASQRNPVPQQNKMGSLLNYLDVTGQLGAPGTPLQLPKGYGSLAQGDIVKRAQEIGAGQYPFDDAIKLGKFYKSYMGYHPENAVVDVIGTRVPTMATRDPEWLAKSVKMGNKKEGFQILNPRDMFARGELTMEEALKRPGFWTAAPEKVGEYAGIEDMWKGTAKGQGYKSGEGQALGWYGSAGLDDTAGLKSKPMTWEESLEQRARERAKETGRHPLDVMSDFLQLKGHLKQGGPVHLADGGNPPRGKAGAAIALGKGALNLFKKSQDPKVAGALEDYLMGRISSPERIAMVRERLPIRPITQIPERYTDQQISDALMANKRPKAFAPIEPGAIVGNRLDIPAYTQHGVYVDTTHAGGKGSPISYTRTGHLKDVSFESDPDFFVRVGLGTKEQGLTPLGKEMGVGKGPSAVIKGRHQPTSEEDIRRAMAEIMNDPNWTQVGMNPYRHSQFYDKSDMMPVWSAEEKLQIGPLIMVPKRGLEKTDWEDPRLLMRKFEDKKYAEGGLAQYAKGGHATPAWQRKEGQNPEGGLNAAGRASYKRETGGELKRPQPEGGPRRDSFCARMKGMKKKLTSAETANDPDSRINKSLRAWNC